MCFCLCGIVVAWMLKKNDSDGERETKKNRKTRIKNQGRRKKFSFTDMEFKVKKDEEKGRIFRIVF